MTPSFYTRGRSHNPPLFVSPTHRRSGRGRRIFLMCSLGLCPSCHQDGASRLRRSFPKIHISRGIFAPRWLRVALQHPVGHELKVRGRHLLRGVALPLAQTARKTRRKNDQGVSRLQGNPGSRLRSRHDDVVLLPKGRYRRTVRRVAAGDHLLPGKDLSRLVGGKDPPRDGDIPGEHRRAHCEPDKCPCHVFHPLSCGTESSR
jgi:hypothetical protein